MTFDADTHARSQLSKLSGCLPGPVCSMRSITVTVTVTVYHGISRYIYAFGSIFRDRGTDTHAMPQIPPGTLFWGKRPHGKTQGTIARHTMISMRPHAAAFHTYIHTYIYLHTTYIHTYVRAYIHTYIHNTRQSDTRDRPTRKVTLEGDLDHAVTVPSVGSAPGCWANKGCEMLLKYIFQDRDRDSGIGCSLSFIGCCLNEYSVTMSVTVTVTVTV